MLTETKVFDRIGTESDQISPAYYNLVLGLTLLWGFAINYLMVKNIDPGLFAGSPILFMIGYFACSITGMVIVQKSDKPLISFLGYNLVVLPLGLLVNMVVAQYDPRIVQDALRTTGMVTFAMMILGSLFPKFFQKIAGALTIALIAVILIELVSVFFFKTHHGIFDWIVALIFCGYIGYDWARANMIPKTVDNAIDSAAALYMDIVFLFLRILRILGNRN